MEVCETGIGFCLIPPPLPCNHIVRAEIQLNAQKLNIKNVDTDYSTITLYKLTDFINNK